MDPPTHLAPREELLHLGHDAPRFLPAELRHGCWLWFGWLGLVVVCVVGRSG